MVQEPDNYYRKVAVPELGGVFSRIMAFKKGGGDRKQEFTSH